jgi:DNA topoisomerase-1
MTHGSLTPYIAIKAAPLFKPPHPHHSEAGLVKMLEEMGIGRPSTFATLVDKIQERDYVQKKNIEPKKVRCFEYTLGGPAAPKKGEVIKTAVTKEVGGERQKLLLQPIGRIVSDFLNTHFASILNYEYTCAMEKALDDVAAGAVSMAEVCGQCDAGLEACITAATSSAIKIQHVFGGGTGRGRGTKGAPELIVGRQGPVIKMCSPDRFIPLNPPFCDTFDLAMFAKVREGELALSDLIPAAELTTLSASGEDSAACPAPLATASVVDLGMWEGKQIYVKTGKFGPYVSLAAPAATPAGTTGKRKSAKTAPAETRTLKPLGIRTPLTQYTRDEVIALLEGRVDDPKIVRKLRPDLSIRIGPKGSQYIYYKTVEMKKPAFYKLKGFLDDPANCDTAIIMDWILQKYPACGS